MPVGTLVCRQDPDLSSCHLLLVYGNSLADVVYLTLHLPDLGALQVEHLQEVVGEGVDLVSHAGQTLGRVALGLLQSRPLVVALRRKYDYTLRFRLNQCDQNEYNAYLEVVVLAVLGDPLEVRVGVHQVLSPLRDLRSDQRVQIGSHPRNCNPLLSLCQILSGEIRN